MISDAKQTRADRVYAELRADILGGRRLPGARLPFAELLARHQASMGVLREALSRLVAEGLVEAEPQRGFRVVPLSVADLRHLTEARLAVETLVLRQAMEHGGLSWESEVLAAHHRLERTAPVAPDDPNRVSDDWAAAHAAFHHTLLSGCRNPRLLAVAQSLRDSAELYRRWSLPLDDKHRDVAGEHRRMLDAVLNHDVEAAVDALAEHIQHTTRVLLDRSADLADDAASV